MTDLTVPYPAPVVKDYGDVWDMTATAHPVLGVATHGDLSWSNPMYPANPNSGPGVTTHHGHPFDQSVAGTVGNNGTPSGTATQGNAGTAAHGSTSTGSSSPGGGSSPPAGASSGGGGGGTLPFTGLAVGAVAAAGGAFTAAGGALRRALRRRANT